MLRWRYKAAIIIITFILVVDSLSAAIYIRRRIFISFVGAWRELVCIYLEERRGKIQRRIPYRRQFPPVQSRCSIHPSLPRQSYRAMASMKREKTTVIYCWTVDVKELLKNLGCQKQHYIFVGLIRRLIVCGFIRRSGIFCRWFIRRSGIFCWCFVRRSRIFGLVLGVFRFVLGWLVHRCLVSRSVNGRRSARDGDQNS